MVSRLRVPLSTFEFGEVSSSFTSRVDTETYKGAAERLKNLVILTEGGVKRRPGLKRQHEMLITPYAGSERTDMEVRAEPFVFSDDEKYLFVFSDQRIDFYRVRNREYDSAYKADMTYAGSLTQDVNSDPLPWTYAEVPQFTYAYAGDYFFVCHENFMPRMIIRTDLNNFEVRTFAFETEGSGSVVSYYNISQPYHAFHPFGVSIDPSSPSGSMTLTTSANYFTPDHVGVFLLIHETLVRITSYISPTSVGALSYGPIETRLVTNAFQSTNGSAEIRVAHPHHGLSAGDAITVADADTIGGINASQINGSRTITRVVDGDTYEFTAGATANKSEIGGGTPKIGSDAPTTEFFEQSFSDVRGYPSAVAFHEGRLWFGGTPSQPDHLWASASGRYFDFDVGDGEDDESIDLSAGIGEFSQVRHIVSNRDLQIFSTSSEGYVPALTEQPITPSTAQIKRQTPFGSSYLRPQPIDGTTVYCQASGNIIGSYLFSDTEASYTVANLTGAASHLLSDPVQLAVAHGAYKRAETYAYVVNKDGTIAPFYSYRIDKKAGWMYWNTDGLFKTMAVVDDRTFAVVQRDRGDGVQKYYVEEFHEGFLLDSGTLYPVVGDNYTDVSGEYPDGAVLDAVAIGIGGSGIKGYLGEFTVASGNVSYGQDVYSIVELGLSYNLEIRTLPVEIQLSTGPITAEPRHVSMASLDLVDTLSVSVNGKEIAIRNVTDNFDTAPTPYNGKKDFRMLGYSNNPKVTISQSYPLPFQLNGMVLEVII